LHINEDELAKLVTHFLFGPENCGGQKYCKYSYVSSKEWCVGRVSFLRFMSIVLWMGAILCTIQNVTIKHIIICAKPSTDSSFVMVSQIPFVLFLYFSNISTITPQYHFFRVFVEMLLYSIVKIWLPAMGFEVGATAS
jgi:hypothetical protein